jgi:hypothetical protein
MPKPEAAFAAALSMLLLASCGGQERASAQNNIVAAEGVAGENAAPADPAQPGAPDNSVADPAPPPDAVSHPDGYLPPAPDGAEPAGANASGPASPPATEDEYIRNGQRGR